MTQDEQKILNGIVERFQNKAAGDEKLLRLWEKQDNGTLTWEDVKAFSEEIGILSSEALQEAAGEITALGPGNGYDAVIEALRANSYTYVSEYADTLIKIQNEQVGIGMNASQPVFNENKASGIASKAAHGETEEETRRALGTPVKTFTESVVNDTIESNARSQSMAGLEPKVIRTGGHKCCDWCEAHTGKWVYGDQPSDFFRQHANCTCMIEFSSKKIRYRVNGAHNKGYGVSQKGWGTTVTGKELEKRIEEQEKRIKAQKVFIPEETLKERIEKGKKNLNNQGVIAERILQGEYSINLKHQKYLQHVKGTPQFNNAVGSRGKEQSFLVISEEETQQLILQYAGTGDIKKTKNGDVLPQEFITADKVIGSVPINGKETETRRAMIKYSSNGAHVVPVKDV